jgi:hypothetical protein
VKIYHLATLRDAPKFRKSLIFETQPMLYVGQTTTAECRELFFGDLHQFL